MSTILSYNSKGFLIKQLTFILAFLMVFFTFQQDANAQDPVLTFTGKVTDNDGKKISGVTVKILQDGKEVFSKTTNGGGKFPDFPTDYDHKYLIEFSKEGYVTKKVEVDAKTDYYAEDVGNGDGVPVNISLFKGYPDVDYGVVSNKPVARARFDEAAGLLNYDHPFIQSRRKEIDKFLAKVESERGAKDKEFNDLVVAGNKAFSSEKYEAAITNFEKALKIKTDSKVKDKRDEAADLLAKQEKSNADQKSNSR